MNCCDIAPTIVKGFYRTENDDTPDATTRLFRVLVKQCVNPKCPNYGNTWEEEHEESIGKYTA